MRSMRCWRVRPRQRQRAIVGRGVCVVFAFALILVRLPGVTSEARAQSLSAGASQALSQGQSNRPSETQAQKQATARGKATRRASSEVPAQAKAEVSSEEGVRVHVETRPQAVRRLNHPLPMAAEGTGRCADNPPLQGEVLADGRDANLPPAFAEATQAILPEARENLAPKEVGLCGTCPAKSAIQPWPWEAVFNPICAVDEMILTEPEGGLSTPIQHLVYGGIATLVPALGLRLGQGASRSRLSLSWPWSLPLGPVMASTREEGPCQERVFEMRPLRLLLEPSLAFTSPVTFAVRPGVQAMFQRASWNVGIGAGLGSTVETTGPYGLRASISPELLLNWGRCCGPGFLRLALRYDLFFGGRERHAFSTHVGFSFY